MKLVKQTDGSWHYLLDENEFVVLDALLEKFPFTDPVPGKISQTDKKPDARERENLLNESLAERRQELQELAGQLRAPEKLLRQGKDHLMVLNLEDRETLLQILNDIRVGCWHALGQPEKLEPKSDNLSEEELANYSLMNVAGYFEQNLMAPGK